MRKDRLSGSGAFLSDENFIGFTISKVVEFHAIVSESSGFSVVAADSEGGENIAFRNILNFS